MEYVIDKAKFYESREDSINIIKKKAKKEEVVIEEVFSEFDVDTNTTATLKSLKKCLALNNVQVEEIGVHNAHKKRKVLFPKQLEDSRNIRMARRKERNDLRAELLKEQRLSQEILMQEYDEFRINEEIDEMFRLYRPEHKNENGFEVVLDCTKMEADEINEILDQENA